MISCENITYKYEDGTIGIKDFSFCLSNGKIIGIIGANGSGKSTFFKCLLGLLKPQVGQIHFKGNPLSYSKGDLKNLRKNINLVFQDPERQIFYSDVRQDVALGPKNLGLSDQEIQLAVDRALDAVRGQELQERPIQYLSFGQKKRIAIAGILAMNCDVLLMDEPETGLDPLMRREMTTLMNQLKSDGKKMVLSSHNMDLIYTLCDYIYVIHKGTVVAHGETEHIMTNQSLLESCDLELPIQVAVRQAQ